MTREWTIYDKTGEIVRTVVKSLQYNGEYMSDRYITVTVKSPYPIPFEIGDRMTYRGDEFVLTYIPAMKRQARSGSTQTAIVYDGIRFKSSIAELENCQFTDYVQDDNLVHYTGLGSFGFYVTSLRDFGNRIKACLDNKYGVNYWTVAYGSVTITDKQFSVSSGTSVWNALAQFNNAFKVNFTVRGRTITLGPTPEVIGHSFVYGKGNGLKSLEQTVNTDQKVVTLLRAYGSTRNLPYRFYNEYYRRKYPALFDSTQHPEMFKGGKSILESKYMPNLMLPYRVWSEHPWDAYILSERVSQYGTRDGEKIFDGSDENWEEIFPSLKGMTTDNLSSIYGYAGSTTYQSSKALDRALYGSSVADNGVSADGSYEEGAEDTNGTAIHTSFEVRIPNVGFNPWDYLIDGETPYIEFTSGLCTSDHGKFEILGVELANESNVSLGYILRLQRVYDSNINMYYPNSTFQVAAGDHFIFTGISMPDVYVEAAEERLLEQAQQWLSENDREHYTYRPEIDNIFMANHPELSNSITEGMKFMFYDDELGIVDAVSGEEKIVTIKQLVIKECDGGDDDYTIPKYEITLSDDYEATLMEAVESKVHSLLGSAGSGASFNTAFANLQKEVDKKLSRVGADTAAGHITFQQGLTSNTDVDINGETETDTLVVNDYVDGDLDVHGDINAVKEGNTGGNIHADGDIDSDSDIHADGDVSGLNVSASNQVSGNTVKATESIEIGAYDQATQQGGKIWVDQAGHSHATFDVLDVRQQMRVTELVVDRAKSVGGTLVVSPANMTVDRVEWLTADNTANGVVTTTENLVNGFKLYFQNEDSEKEITNEWAVGDQAFCRTWNIKEGTTKNYENKYYWRRVTEVGDDYIILSMDDADNLTLGNSYMKVDKPEGDPSANGYYELSNETYTLSEDTTVSSQKTYYKLLTHQSSWPSAGDYISVLGNNVDTSRQSAIIISAYGDNAPYEYDYQGINTFSLSGGTAKVVYKKEWDATANNNAGGYVVRIGDDTSHVLWNGTTLDVVGNFSTSVGGTVVNVGTTLSNLSSQVGTLGENIAAISGQEDIQIWFGDDIPSASNYPAVDWTTNDLKALHDQDIYYSREQGGRAWRYVYDLEESLTITLFDGTVTTYAAGYTGWVEITDQYTLEALAVAAAAKQKVDNLADDGILSAGSEKAQLLISWNDVVSSYIQYPPQAQDYIEMLDPESQTPGAGNAQTSDQSILLARELYAARNGFITAVQSLGNWLNGLKESDFSGTPSVVGAALSWPDWSSLWGNPLAPVPTPAYISSYFGTDTVLSTFGQTKAGYRNVWNEYYSAFNTLLRLLTKAGKFTAEKAQKTADDAITAIEEISLDGVLDASEIPSLRREFEAAYRERAQMVDLATDDTSHKIINSVLRESLDSYLSAFKAVANYLNKQGFNNNGTTIGAWSEPTTYTIYTPDDPAQIANKTWQVGAKTPLVDADFPTLLQMAHTEKFQADWSSPNENGDGGVAFRNLWAALSEKQVALANAISELAKETADGAQSDLDDLGNDAKITPIEKVALKREFLCYWHEMRDTNGIIDQAATGNASPNEWYASPLAYIGAFESLGAILNGGNTWSSSSSIYDYNLPSALKPTENGGYINVVTSINASSYRSCWESFFSERGKLIAALIAKAQETANSAYIQAGTGTSEATLNALIEQALNNRGERCKVFTNAYDSTRPIGYKVGDLWINLNTGNNAVEIWNPSKTNAQGVVTPGVQATKLAGETLVCWRVTENSNDFPWSDWQILDHYVRSWIKSSADEVTAGVSSSLSTSGGDLNSIFNQLLVNKYGATLTSEWVQSINGSVATLTQAGFVTSTDVNTAFASLFAQKAQQGDVVSRAIVESLIDNDGAHVRLEAIENYGVNDNLFYGPEWLTTLSSTGMSYRSSRWYVNSLSKWFLSYSAGSTRESLYARFSMPATTMDNGAVGSVYMNLFGENKRTSGSTLTISQTIESDIISGNTKGAFILSVYVKNDVSRTSSLSTNSSEETDRNNYITIRLTNATIIQSIVSETEGTRLGYSDEEGARKKTISTGTNPEIMWEVTDGAWHRLWVVFTASSTTCDAGIRTYYSYSSDSGTGISTYYESGFWVAKPKLEYGYAPTKWIPGESDMTRTGIDISRGKIRLDADNVEVAKDLTIGGNTRIGGFSFNIQNRLTSGMVHDCYNPLDFGILDYNILGGSTSLSMYTSKNILFPECGSSLLIDDSAFTLDANNKAAALAKNKVNINLPFWHEFALKAGTGGADTVVLAPGNINDGYLDDYINAVSYSSGDNLPTITSANTSQNDCTKFLIRQLINGKSICREYLGSEVMIENQFVEPANNGVWVYGVKGVAPSNEAFNSSYNTKRWYQFEPWNRGTVTWTFTDYVGSSNYAAQRWVQSNSIPKDDEAFWIIEGQRYLQLDSHDRAYTSNTGYRETTRRYMNDRIWTSVEQSVTDADFLSDLASQENTDMGRLGYNDEDKMLPFVIPPGFFAKLRLVFKGGWFYWEIVSFGEI